MSAWQSIAELAYRLWTERGRPHGSEEEDWLEAERQLAARENSERDGNARGSDTDIDTSLEATFPASDPPASHIPDTPPVNAAEKWEAAAQHARQDRKRGVAP